MSPIDYIREYRAKRSPGSMVAPWAHRSLLVRAMWWKIKGREWEVARNAAPYPSAEWDEAFDEALSADEKYEAAIIEAWTLRALERGYTQSQRAA